jgi:hypothetical protein
MTPNDDFVFDVASFYDGIRDPSVFNLPSACDATKMCPTVSVCTAVRAMNFFEEAKEEVEKNLD